MLKNNIIRPKREKLKKECSEEVSNNISILFPPVKHLDVALGAEDKSGKKKKGKRNKIEFRDIEYTEDSLNDIYCDKKDHSQHKKRKKAISVDAEEYKPGMLSDILQKQKYGYLVLPWEASFGKRLSQSDLISKGDGSEQKSNLKINPLFNTSKTSDGNVVLKSCPIYTVFIGNLPQNVTVNRVKKIFKKFSNTISKVKIRSEISRKHKINANSNQYVGTANQCKHAIVKFNSLESYKAALKMNGKQFDGHHLRITGGEGKTTSDPEKSVFVGNLPTGITDDVLWKAFENCGAIDSVRVIKDKLNKKGVFGYVNFQCVDAVTKALALDSTLLLTREIRVSHINKNIDSLSNSVTVKRNKKKQAKYHLLSSSSSTTTTNKKITEVGIDKAGNVPERKSLKSPTQKNSRHFEEETELNISAKKKRKKKRSTDGVRENKDEV